MLDGLPGPLREAGDVDFVADGAVRTPDLGGTAGTRELTEAVLAAVPA